MSKTTELKAQLRALSQAYKARQELELQDMLHTATQLPAGTSTLPEEVSTLRNHLHKLAGSAGTFGYPDLGVQARKLEQLAKACMDQHYLDASARLRLVTGIQALPHWLMNNEADPQPAAPVVTLPDTTARVRIIAILETDPQLLHATCQTLNSFGYQTLGFTDFKRLREALQQALPDALVIATGQAQTDDAALAYITGLQSQLTRPLPLIVIADADPFSAQMQAVRAGAQGFFTRPVDLPALENRLEGCFNSLQSEPFRVLIVDDDLDLASRFEAVLNSAGIFSAGAHAIADADGALRTGSGTDGRTHADLQRAGAGAVDSSERRLAANTHSIYFGGNRYQPPDGSAAQGGRRLHHQADQRQCLVDHRLLPRAACAQGQPGTGPR